MMNCPYCGSEMEEGALVSRMVPLWVKKGEKREPYWIVKRVLRRMNCRRSVV